VIAEAERGRVLQYVARLHDIGQIVADEQVVVLKRVF
jgi:hypothetical protein